MTERWLPIPGYEDAYEVSDDGQVRSIDRVVLGYLRRGKILRQQTGINGYQYVTLRYQNPSVHTLVAAAFIGPRPDGYVIAHANGVKADNQLANLRYCTRSENESDKLRHGTRVAGAIKAAKLTPHQVIEIKSLLGSETQRQIAARYNISQSVIARIATGQIWGWLCVTSY
jgi:hypothetical protein